MRAEAGAILGRAPRQHAHLIAAYGRDLGAAFQIADDVLDAIGTAKPPRQDRRQGPAAGKATMVSILGVERARTQAEILAEQATSHLESFGPEADRLRALAHFVVARNS